MSFGMRLRLWARQASPGELAGTVVGVLAVIVVLVLATLPVVSRDDDSTRRGISAGGGDAGTELESSSDEGAATGEPGAAGSGEQAAAASGASTAKTAAGARTTGGGKTAGATNAPLTASDIGITATTIKVGFLIAQVGGLDQAGFALGLRGDIEAVIKAYVDDVNKRGGVLGRKIIYVTAKVDPLSASNQRAACLHMIDDEKVFAVLDSATTLGAAELCYGAEHKVPYFNTGLSSVSASYVKRNFPWQVSTFQDGTRQVINWAEYVGREGRFNNQKLGILSDECVPNPEVVDSDLKPVLARFGVTPVVVKLSCDASTAQQQIPGAVLQMRRENVTLVLPGTIFTNVQVFLQTADAQQWHPKYTASDWWGMSVDLFVKNFPPGQWNGTQAVTATHVGEPKSGIPFPAPSQACSKVLTDAGLAGLSDYDKDAEAVVHCDSVRLFALAATKAGACLTRLGWANAVQALGSFDSAFTAKSVFRPGKTEGGDSLALVQWSADCKCNSQIRRHDRDAYA